MTREQFFRIWQVLENEQGIDIGARSTGEVFHIDQSVDGWRIYSNQSGLTPPVSLVLAAFVMMVGLLRYGTQSPISPQHLALSCTKQPELAAYFACPVTWYAPQAFIEWTVADLDKPFIAYNQAIADMLAQTLDGMANSRVPTYTAQV